MQKGFLAWALVILTPLAIGALVFRALIAEEPRPLDVGAALAAIESSSGETVVHQTLGADVGPLAGTWVDPKKDLITKRETVNGSDDLQVKTPRVILDYSERFNTVYESPPPPAEAFAPETYNRQLKLMLKNGSSPQSTGRSKAVGGKRAKEYEDVLPAEGDRPKAGAKLYVDPATDAVLREEYEFVDPESLRTNTVAIERVPRDRVPGDALLTPTDVEGIAGRDRRERIENVAGLPHEVPWVGETFGNLALVKLEADDFWVRLDYAAADDPRGPEVLSVIVQAENGKSTEEASADPERSRPKTTPEGKKVAYEAGPLGPDGGQTEFAAFKEGRAKVLVQKSGEVEDGDGTPLSVLEVVDNLRAVR